MRGYTLFTITELAKIFGYKAHNDMACGLYRHKVPIAGHTETGRRLYDINDIAKAIKGITGRFDRYNLPMPIGLKVGPVKAKTKPVKRVKPVKQAKPVVKPPKQAPLDYFSRLKQQLGFTATGGDNV